MSARAGIRTLPITRRPPAPRRETVGWALRDTRGAVTGSTKPVTSADVTS